MTWSDSQAARIPAIVNSFAQLGANASGVSVAQNPSDIMTQGLQIVSDLFTKVSSTSLLTEPGGAITTILAACIVLASYIIITLHYVVTKLEAIIVMSAGYIFLGFSESRWTSPYCEMYISLAVSTGVRLMLIYLMLGVFKTISNNWIATMNGYTADQPITQIFPTLMSMLLFAFASWMIPKMAASIASETLGSGQDADSYDCCVGLRRDKFNRVFARHEASRGTAHLADHRTALHGVWPDGRAIHRGRCRFEPISGKERRRNHHNHDRADDDHPTTTLLR